MFRKLFGRSTRPGNGLAHYELTEKIGEGGMGVVWRARDTRLGRDVAIKLLPDRFRDDPERLKRFEREARAIAALNHPGIVTIYSVENHAGVAFITLELVRGRPLEELIPDIGMPLDQLLSLSLALAEAVAAAHRAGIVHRDLKPGNVMVDDEGRLKVLDFGLAAARNPIGAEPDAETISTQTDGGPIVGTIPYMAPEQLRGEPTDYRSDVYALGVVVYEMAAGRRPFVGESRGELIAAILRDEPTALLAVRQDLPTELASLVGRCLHKDPARRIAGAREAHDELHALQLRLTKQALAAEIRAHPEGVAAAGRAASIVVLPFTDLSPEGDQEYFCEGLAEDVHNTLARLDGLRIAARSRAVALKREGLDVVRIARQMGVDHVLDGSVRKSGDRLRITAQLVDAASGTSMWSESFDRHSIDIFAVQDEISAAIADKLPLREPLAAHPESKHHTTDHKAYELYLRGRFFWNQRFAGGLQRGIESFAQAISADPSYPLPHTGLADCYVMLAHYGYAPATVAYEKARASVERALELDVELPEAHATKAWILAFSDWQRLPAERHLERALALNPHYATAYEWYGIFLASAGRFDEALAMLDHASQIDPLALIIRSIRGYVLVCRGAFDEAAEELRRVLELDDRFIFANLAAGLTRVSLGDHEAAIAATARAADLSARSPLMVAHLGWVYGVTGHEQQARDVLDELDAAAPETPVTSYQRGLVHHGLGETATALDFFERAADEHDSFFATSQTGPHLRALRSEPRFVAILQRMGVD